MFSDAPGQFEAIIFSDTLANSRDLLEPGTAVLLSVAAERDGDTLKMRVEGIDGLDRAVGQMQSQVRVVFDPSVVPAPKLAAAMAELKGLLKPGRGEIRLVVPMADAGQEIELSLKGRFDVSPASRGLISTVPGVLAVAEA